MKGKFIVCFCIALLADAMSMAGMPSMSGGASASSTGGAAGKEENTTVNVTNQEGEMDQAPTMGALVEVVNRDKMERDIGQTLSEMKDKMGSMMQNISSRLDQIEEAGKLFFFFKYTTNISLYCSGFIGMQ